MPILSRIVPIHGGEMIVDDAFVVPKGHLRVSGYGYAELTTSTNGKYKYQLIHRLVIGAQRGEIVDHINSNRLDNRRENLRLATLSENAGHRRVKGWTYHRKSGRFQAAIVVAGKCTHLGLFDTAEQATAAYEQANIRLRGAFAATVERT